MRDIVAISPPLLVRMAWRQSITGLIDDLACQRRWRGGGGSPSFLCRSLDQTILDGVSNLDVNNRIVNALVGLLLVADATDVDRVRQQML